MIRVEVALFIACALLVKGLNCYDCIDCNSDANPACISSVSSVKTTCQANRCYSYQHPETKYVERGCALNGIPQVCTDDFENCNLGSSNNEPYKIECLDCSSQTNVDCKDNPENVRTYCPSETCFGRNDPNTNIFTRGCLEPEQEQECIEDLDCFSCKDSQHCNQKQNTLLECFQCEGGDCVTVDVATQTRQRCKEGGKCLTEINLQGEVVRKCTESADEKCAEGKDCSICENSLCNGDLFPANRLKCLQCDSAVAGDECSLSNVRFSKACNTYNKEDQCFTFADESNLLHRGCVSDNNAGCKDDNCLKCIGENCNNNGLDVPNTLRCVKCDSSEEEECEAGKILDDKVVACEGTHNLKEKETCFAQNITSADNKITTKRGCFFELTAAEQTACSASESCHVCGVDGCNKIDNYSESKGFKCFVCSSENNEGCSKENVPGLTAEVCSITPNSFNEGPGCFVQRTEEDIIIRDCKTSASSHNLQLENCSVDTEEQGKKCIVCEGDSCNTMKVPGSATSLKIFGTLIALSALSVIKVF